MKLFEALRKLLKYNVFDEFVEHGALRVDEFPKNPIWMERPSVFRVDNIEIQCCVWVAGVSDSVVIADRKKRRVTKILIRDLNENPDVKQHPSKLKRWWNRHNRPYLYGNLKVGFGTEGDQYIEDHNDYKPAEQGVETEHG